MTVLERRSLGASARIGARESGPVRPRSAGLPAGGGGRFALTRVPPRPHEARRGEKLARVKFADQRRRRRGPFRTARDVVDQARLRGRMLGDWRVCVLLARGGRIGHSRGLGDGQSAARIRGRGTRHRTRRDAGGETTARWCVFPGCGISPPDRGFAYAVRIARTRVGRRVFPCAQIRRHRAGFRVEFFARTPASIVLGCPSAAGAQRAAAMGSSGKARGRILGLRGGSAFALRRPSGCGSKDLNA